MAGDWSAIKDLIEKTGSAFDEYKKVNDDRLKALADGNESKALELSQKLEKIDTDMTDWAKKRKSIETEIENQRERIEELEAKGKTPGKTVEQKLDDEHAEKFIKAMRGGLNDQRALMELKQIEAQVYERKDVTIGTGSAGGYGVPEQIAREIERQEKLYSPVTEDCKVVTVGTSDYKELVDLTGTLGGWAGETTDRSTPTATATLREVVPTWGEQYAYPQVSEWSLDDVFFNVQDWLTTGVAESFAVDLATAVVSGNGSTKPTGMTNTTPTTVDDFGSPLRSAAIYQYVASAASPDAITSDSLIDVQYKLNSRYRTQAKYIFNSTVAGAIRKLKDSQNQYLWQPGLQNGEPDRLLGYATSIWEQMPNVTNNAFPVAFGNFKRGYVIAQRYGSLRITRDDVTKPGYVRFYVRRRVSGIPLNNNAIKFIRTT